MATFRKGVRAIQLVGRASELFLSLCMRYFVVLYWVGQIDMAAIMKTNLQYLFASPGIFLEKNLS